MGYTESGHQDEVTRYFSKGLVQEPSSWLHPGYILLFIFLILSSLQTSSGQRKSDIGIIAGTSYYLGDLNHTRHFYSPSPSGGIIVRYNFNPRNSLRFSGIYAMLRGDPADFEQPFPNSPNSSFSTELMDVGITSEFNFMPYETTKVRRDRYTPYVSGGIGYTVVLGGNYSLNLTFGGGFKYNVTGRLSTGFEWSMKKSFSDELDGVQNIGYENNAFFHNKDWYSIVGVFVTYKIFDWGLDCPAYE